MTTVRMFLMMALIFGFAVSADAKDHGKAGKAVPPVTNELYRKTCGACHFAYQPGLLPGRSWTRVLDDSHPGGPLTLDPEQRRDIGAYLLENSAEHSPAKRSKKILSSLGGTAPVRISETPYIREKHRDLSQEVFSLKSIGSRANCPACHRSAAQGIYDDDDVSVPR